MIRCSLKNITNSTLWAMSIIFGSHFKYTNCYHSSILLSILYQKVKTYHSFIKKNVMATLMKNWYYCVAMAEKRLSIKYDAHASQLDKHLLVYIFFITIPIQICLTYTLTYFSYFDIYIFLSTFWEPSAHFSSSFHNLQFCTHLHASTSM